MSPLDYIYSDTINMLMALNRRVLDVTGRLSLMSPQPEVMQILKRAGIHNILRIFETETELMKSSEDMILQTTSIKLSDINNAIKQAPPPPQSEFDQLRSEIGSAFGSHDSEHSGQEQQSHYEQAKPSGQENEFNRMFHQIDSPGISNQGPGYGVPPIQPQAPRFQQRQYTQPSAPQPMPIRPSFPTSPGQSANIPKSPSPDYSSIRSETQRFSTAPAKAFDNQDFAETQTSKRPKRSADEDLFDSSSKSKSSRKMKEEFDSFDDDDEVFKKKSALPVLVVILLVIILGGAGLAISRFVLKDKDTAPVTTTVFTPAPAAVPEAVPQIPVDTQSSVSPPSEEVKAAVKEVTEMEPEKEKPTVRKTTPKRRSTPVRKSSYTPPKRPERETPEPEERNQVVFTSSPSGAEISVNGQKIGTTPYTWSRPFFGNINVQITKQGYSTARKSFEFTGGSANESFSLERETVKPPPPPPVASKPTVKEEPPVAMAPARSTPPPPPSGGDEDEDLFGDTGGDDDFLLEPEPAKSSPPAAPVRTPAAPTRSSTYSPPSGGGGGGEAQIFIASIPPVADVYIGDKLVGKTNVSELKLPSGPQSIRFVKGGKEITKEIILKPGKNPSQMVRIP